MTAEPDVTTILLATGNRGKVRELQELLAAAPIRLCGLADAGVAIQEVDETGVTFTENAVLKATGYAAQSGLCALADDSGLEVEALDGAPGVLSARYGGADLPFAEKMQLVLDRMNNSENRKRTARFVCAMALADPAGNVIAISEGVCPGTIAASPRGIGGFGYDPIFVPDGFDKTFGELSEEIKSAISHRALAVAKIMRYLLAFTGRLT